jgi:hypothetical protein
MPLIGHYADITRVAFCVAMGGGIADVACPAEDVGE